MAITSRDIFVQQNEVELAQLHGAVITPGGNLGANYCVLTNKRVYHKGVSVALGAKGNISTGETIIDLKNVSGTSFSVRRFPILMVIGILALLGGLVMFFLGDSNGGDMMSMLPIGLLVFGAIFILLYFICQAKIYTLLYRGGVLSFRASGIPTKALRAFSACVHNALEYATPPVCEAPVEVAPVEEQAPIETPVA
jgi:hypothetical protein